ncbi:MAG: nicotinamide mononucleotide transporter PnuC [Bacteriovoracaceae bacterium]|nr:nicotinamide mononucleotide transporter PnuC [Bacteriovoracaceae bacterium]
MKKLSPLQFTFYFISIAASILLLLASSFKWIDQDITEAWGFVTGAWCVWLVALENIWNFPIGLANSVFYFVLFFQARLFADAFLQVVYFILEIIGWYQWLRGGEKKTALKVSRTSLKTWGIVILFLTAGTVAIQWILIRVKGAAPFTDALTTSISLAAQFMMNAKLFENWHLWLIADVIYVWLYISRGLYLTSLLYFIFILLCFAGIRYWGAALKALNAKK